MGYISPILMHLKKYAQLRTGIYSILKEMDELKHAVFLCEFSRRTLLKMQQPVASFKGWQNAQLTQSLNLLYVFVRTLVKLLLQYFIQF